MREGCTSPREIAELNIEYYCRLLRTTSPNGPARAIIERLLAEETARLASLSATSLEIDGGRNLP